MARMPQVSARELVRFLKAQGFVEDRQSGSHLTLRHTTRKLTVTVPAHTGVDVGRGLAVRLLKDAGLPWTTTSGCAEPVAGEGDHRTGWPSHEIEPPAGRTRPAGHDVACPGGYFGTEARKSATCWA
jgi:predicted RNA binding protein YcfA (HicA-like mRNA interferase family)